MGFDQTCGECVRQWHLPCTCPDWWFPEDRSPEMMRQHRILKNMAHGAFGVTHSPTCSKLYWNDRRFISSVQTAGGSPTAREANERVLTWLFRTPDSIVPPLLPTDSSVTLTGNVDGPQRLALPTLSMPSLGMITESEWLLSQEMDSNEANQKLAQRIEQLEDDLVATRAALQKLKDRDPQADMTEAAAALAGGLDRALQIVRWDTSGLADALAKIISSVRGRMWVAEGRGPYEWDDDRYKEEAGQALMEVLKIARDALSESGKRVQASFNQCRPALEQYRGMHEHRRHALSGVPETVQCVVCGKRKLVGAPCSCF